MIAGHDDDWGDLGQGEECVVDDRLRLWGWRRRIEQIARHDGEVDVLITCDARDLGEHLTVLIGAASASYRPANMPVARMEELHASDRTEHVRHAWR